MSFAPDDYDFSAAAFHGRSREFTFWTGVIGLLLSAVVYASIYLSGHLILHYKISSYLYATFLVAMVLSSYFDFKVKAVTNFSILSLFFVFWLSSYIEASGNNSTFLSTPLVLFVPILMMMVLHHKLVFGVALIQFGFVFHYSYNYGTLHYASDWAREEQLYLSFSFAFLSTVCLIAVGIVSLQRLFTDKKLQALVADQTHLATTDSLTGVPNRRAFTAKLRDMLEQAQFVPDMLKVGIVDLDGFKSVNDVYGHVAGDELLVQVAARLHAELPGGAYLARLGGDEFGVCLFVDPDDESCLGSKLCARLAEPFQLEQALVRIGGSAGFTRVREMGVDISSLLERADYALYKAKADAKGDATVFSEGDEHSIERKRAIKRRLLSSDLLGELSVVFQPIVFPETGTVKALEALVRWNNPTLGHIPPDEFISIAESSGRITDISCYVLRRGLEAAANWPDHVMISMNLSAVDLSNQASVDRLLSILKASPIALNRVVLEITETTFMGDQERGNEYLQAFQNLGVHVALDDFGTGYSSLSYMKHLTIKKLKIDRSFITDIETNELARNLLNGIIELCVSIGINCVVEGVENEAQLKIVALNKNVLVQGYYFSKPLSEAEAYAYIMRPEEDLLRLKA